MLLEAAEVTDDSSLTLELLVEAADAALYAGDYSQVVALASRGRAVEARTEPDRFRKDLLGGLAGALSGDYAQAAPLLTGAIARAELLDDPRSLIWVGRLARLAGTIADGSSLTARAGCDRNGSGGCDRARAGVGERSAGGVARALDRVDRLGAAFASPTRPPKRPSASPATSVSAGGRAGVSPISPGSTPCAETRRSHARTPKRRWSSRAPSGADFMVGWAKRALGLLELTLGRPSEATDQLLPLTIPDRPESSPIIALGSDSRPGRGRRSLRATRRSRSISSIATPSGQNDAPVAPRLSLLARCRALVGEAMNGSSSRPRSRTRPRFPRSSRPEPSFSMANGCAATERRAKLGIIFDGPSELFQQLGTPPWAQRAEAELRATGETARRRDPSTLDDLTPQELQIAGLVASGMTNRQIAAQLYLSPRTIEYHLRKIFTKLGLASRTELVRMGVPSGDADL